MCYSIHLYMASIGKPSCVEESWNMFAFDVFFLHRMCEFVTNIMCNDKVIVSLAYFMCLNETKHAYF